MKIGTIDLGERPVMLAPMEDVTDQSFRLICREQGADMVYTEFVSADALIRSIERSFQKMAIAPGDLGTWENTNSCLPRSFLPFIKNCSAPPQ